MHKIAATEIPNGWLYRSACFYVEVTNDARFFTIRDNFNEPVGTITRPSVMGGNRLWESHLPNGDACTTSAVGPRSAFRSFVMAYKR